MPKQLERYRLPPGQQLAAPNVWPLVGERLPLDSSKPWQLSVGGEVHNPFTLDLAQLRELPQVEIITDIHCVTRWSKFDVSFSGVPLQQILDRAEPNDTASFVSFVARSSRNHSSSLPINEAIELGSILALTANGEPLTVEHGGPMRMVVPGKYFYKSVKWVERIELLIEDRLGYWEADSGYHNIADPWREERFISASIDKRTAAAIIETKDFSNRDLLSLDVSKHDLNGLVAKGALLRNANFAQCNLMNADFSDANLSNAKFQGADLRQASFLGADLEGVNFAAADLRGANLSGCSLFGTSFCEMKPGQDAPKNGAVLDDNFEIVQSQFDALTPGQQDYIARFRRH